MSEALKKLLQSPKFLKVWREHAEQPRREAMQAVVALRRKHSDFMKRPIVDVLVPVCEDCWSYGYHLFEREHRPPDIAADGWQTDLLLQGVAPDEIAVIEEGIDDDWFVSIRCHGLNCSQTPTYATDDIYVQTVPFQDYFGELVPDDGYAKRRSARKWMKRLIYDAYGGVCFGCGARVTWDNKSTDHIHPRSEGGPTDPMNLQLLCRDCDERVKANHVPDEEHFTLHFPLIPVTDGFEGVIW
jgi:5-methylcytosine-specific restriction endonuclease McrA